MKFETLKEAFEQATIKAEGYNSEMRIPIFKNEDGTYEAGSIQHFQWQDISDGSFKEVGAVYGWTFDDENNGVDRGSQLQHYVSDNLEEWYAIFEKDINNKL